MILASRLGVDMPELDTKGLQLFAFPLSDAGSLLTIGHLEENHISVQSTLPSLGQYFQIHMSQDLNYV